MVAAERDMHQARHVGDRISVAVERYALHQGRGAVAHARDRDFELARHTAAPNRCRSPAVPFEIKVFSAIAQDTTLPFGASSDSASCP